MARVLESLSFWLIISVHVTFLVLAQDGDQFLHYDFKNSDMYLDGMANTEDGRLHLTNNTETSTGHAFHKSPMKFTASSSSSFSFSTEFVFAIIPLQNPPSYGQGMAFVVAPTTDLRYGGTESSGLGLFNKTNDNKTENHILAVELDTNLSPTAIDKSRNHVGINIESVNAEDIKLILTIKPSVRGAQDGYSWHFTNSGLYTVRSRYDVARQQLDEDLVYAQQLPLVNPLKERVWKQQTSCKIRHFLWQAISGAVAVNERLAHRHLQLDRKCSTCGDCDETINHVLFTCPPARQVWALSNIPNPPDLFPSDNLWGNMDYLFSRIPGQTDGEEHSRCFPWIIWYLWKARNAKVFNNVDQTPQAILERARTEAREWFLAKLAMVVPAPAQGQNFEVAASHVDAVFRCFVDGSWKEGDDTCGVGWILHLQDGTSDLLGTRGMRRAISPLHAELSSLLWAMSRLRKYNRYCSAFYTDSQELVRMVESPASWPHFSSELEELQELRISFPDFTLTYCPRGKNEKAYFLAKNARTRNMIFLYVSSSFPPWFSNATVFL